MLCRDDSDRPDCLSAQIGLQPLYAVRAPVAPTGEVARLLVFGTPETVRKWVHQDETGRGDVWSQEIRAKRYRDMVTASWGRPR